MGKTKANTGQCISREGTAFTCNWAIAPKGTISWQKLRYRGYNNGWAGWVYVNLGKKATSWTGWWPANWTFQGIEIQTQIKNTKNNASDWTSASFWLGAPAAPSLSVSNDSANKTTFTWTDNHSDTDGGMYECCYYRTKLCTFACQRSDKSWSDWLCTKEV